MNAPSLSVLLPFRDAESTLVDAVASTLAQSFADFELLAIDDHSRDTSASLLGRCTDPRLRVVVNPGSGLVDALNHGAREARSEWLVRMDSDDLMHRDRLALLHGATGASPAPDLVASRVELFSDRPLLDGYREYARWQNEVIEPDDIANQIYVESPFAHPSVMLRRSTLLAAGGYRDGDFPEDYELWLRLHRQGARLVKLPEVLLYQRETPGRLSRNASAYRREAFDRLRASSLAGDHRLSGSRPVAYWGAGRKTRKRCRHLIDLGFPPAAWIDIDPAKIGNTVWGAPVVAADWLARQTAKPFVLVYVANHGARELIHIELERLGYRIGEDFLPVG